MLSLAFALSLVVLAAPDSLERVFRVPESVPSGHHIGFIRDNQPPETLSRQNFFIVFPPTVDGCDNRAAEKLLLVDDRSGAIDLRKGERLDHERERERQLFVLAVPVDGADPVSVIVEVQDDNDNAPRFPTEGVKLEISEYARINTGLRLPLATDPDSAPFNVQRYRITSGNVNNAFRLTHQNANAASELYLELVVNGRLDREYRQHYDLTIEAIDGGKPPKIGTLRVQIEVLDANDNHPEFLQARYSASIGLRTAPGIPILRVSARDPDAGDNGRISYAIVSQSLIGYAPDSIPSTPFQLDPDSGTLSLARSLPVSRPLRLPISYELLISARDHGVPDALESSTTVEVIVDGADEAGSGGLAALRIGILWLTDDGENVPEGLSLGYVLARVSIERGFGAVPGRTPAAGAGHDHEELKLFLLGAQSMVCLRQTDTHLISLLVVCGALDRERTPALQLDLLLRNGSASEVLLDHPLRITLRDINDNAPVWNQTHFRFRWMLGADEDGVEEVEDQNGSHESSATIGGPNYIRLVATDPDAGDNARVSYSIVGTDLVSIEPETGILTLDEDKLPLCPSEDQLIFQVQAEDHGEPEPLRSRVNVTLRLVRSAQHAHVHFMQAVYEVQVREDAEPGTCLLQVSAVDKGLCGGQNSSSENAKMHYELAADESELFKMDPVSGTLCTRKAMDLNRHGPTIQLRAVAKNQDGDEAVAQLVVHLQDVNNHSPVFRPREYALLLTQDHMQAQVPLLHIRAHDADVGDRVTYHLGPGLGAELFELDTQEGVLTLSAQGARKLGTHPDEAEDAGMWHALELRAVAQDEGGRKSEEMALIRVRVLPPHFRHCMSFTEPIYRFNVSEETLPGIALGDLRVVDVADPDALRFELVTEALETHRLFAFDETHPNRLLVEAELDADVPGEDAHLLNIKVLDMQNNCTNFTQVLVTVLDVNDNSPRFLGVQNANIEVPEDFPIHKAFYAVQAVDKDKDENGQISYELQSTVPAALPIQVHPSTGVLSLTAPLDAERMPAGVNGTQLLLRVRAQDHGIPPRDAHMELEVTVVDVNDNAPQFDAPEYNIEVPEDAELMTNVHRAQAKDSDLTFPNKRIRYRISQISPSTTVADEEDHHHQSMLGINARTGEIFLRDALDRERVARYAFELEARDGGSPPRAARSRLNMRVLDINDNAPNCTTLTHELRVKAGQKAGERVARLQVADPDEGPNGRVRLRMQHPHDWFELSANGDLHLRKSITSDLISDARNRNALLRPLVIIAEDQSPEQPLASVCQTRIELDKEGLTNERSDQSEEIRVHGSVQREIWLDPETSDQYDAELIRINASGVAKWSIQPDALSQLFTISSDGTLRITNRNGINDALNHHQTTVTVRLEPYRNSSATPKYLTFKLRRREQRHHGTSANVSVAITVPSNWYDNCHKPLYTMDKNGANNTTVNQLVYYRLEAVKQDVASEKALEDGIFELDELSGTLYMVNNNNYNQIPVENGESFGLRVVTHPLTDPDDDVIAPETQLISVKRMDESLIRKRPKCAKNWQKWNISETAPNGSFVGRLEMEEDNNQQSWTSRTFNLVDGDSGLLFRVDPSDGSVYTQKLMGRHTAHNHILVLEIGDHYGEKGTDQELTTRCAISIDVIADEFETSTAGDLQFLSPPNMTIFVANLEQGLYPDNIVHHFVVNPENVAAPLYGIVGGNKDQYFRLNRTSGALSVPNPAKISREITVHRLTVRASKSNPKNGHPLHHSRHGQQNFVLILDHSHRKFAYFEHREMAAKLLIDQKAKGQRQFVAKLRRQDRHVKVRFRLLPPIEGFRMNVEDGNLEYSAPEHGQMDETLKYGQNLTLTVLAEEIGGSGGIDHLLLKIVPRHSQLTNAGPKIEPTSCGNLSVPEGVPVPELTRIRLISGGSSGNIVFGIESSASRQLFRIDPVTGRLGAGNASLDHETAAEHLLMVSATDVSAEPRRADMCTVRVTVLDRNDNAPVFDDQSTPDRAHLPNSARVGHTVARLVATDADAEGPNSRVRYLLDKDPSAMFDLDQNTGMLSLVRLTPYLSDHSGVWISVKAVDMGMPEVMESEPKRIRISWDKRKRGKVPPGAMAFTQNMYFAQVPESRPRGQFVAQLELIHLNGSASYTILSGNHDAAFQVDRNGRVITAQELDAEIREAYELHIVAIVADGHRAETRLDIRVMDANDNAPYISRGTPIRVPEDLPVGSPITSIRATDADISGLPLEFALRNGFSDRFEINRWTGRVHLARKLDFELQQRHFLGVEVFDGANRAFANLSINILDTNDNAPECVKPYQEIVIHRDMAPGKLLTKIEARDQDGSQENARIHYEMIENGTITEWLELNAENAELRLHKMPPSNVVDEFLTVQAVDTGKPPLAAYCSIRITVTSTKRTVPMFAQSNYTFLVSENSPAHVSIGQVLLRPPLPEPLNCDFSLGSGTDNHTITSIGPSNATVSGLINIGFDGQLQLGRALDRETDGEWLEAVVTVGACPPITVVDTVEDTAEQKAWIRLHVLDTNDHLPEFDETNVRELLISDATPIGSELTRFHAMDADATLENARLTYHLLAGNDYGMFQLDRDTGVLWMARWNDTFAVDIGVKDNSSAGTMEDDGDDGPILVILARDYGVPSRAAVWTMRVRMDWARWSGAAPRFAVPSYRKVVSEDSQPGTALFRVQAASRVGGAGGVCINYTLNSGENSVLNETFALDPNTGVVTLIGSLDLETSSNSNSTTAAIPPPHLYGFNVSCQRAYRNATVPVEVHVLGVDEFSPVFTKSAYTFKIAHRSKHGTTLPSIGQVMAFDRDIGYGSRVRYTLDQADTVTAQLVQVQQDTGALSMLRIPDLEQHQESKVLRFTVWAQSGYGGERKRSSATVYIEIDTSDDTSAPNPGPVDEHHAVASFFNLLVLLILPLLLLAICSLSLLILAHAMLNRRNSSRTKQPQDTLDIHSVPKKRAFSVSNCKQLQQQNQKQPHAAGAGAVLSPSFESGQFSYVRRATPPATERHKMGSSASMASNYVNVVNQQNSVRRPAACNGGSRRSAPDSGIDLPDADLRSLACSEDSCAAADAFLSALGIVEEMPSSTTGAQAHQPPSANHDQTVTTKHQRRRSRRRAEEDAFLDELIYAPMDEILPNPPAAGAPAQPNSMQSCNRGHDDLLCNWSEPMRRSRNMMELKQELESVMPFKPLSQVLAEINAQNTQTPAKNRGSSQV